MNQEEIGKKIKKIRIDNNLTQRELADILGVTYQAVSKWENGKNLPDISIMKDICDKYNYKLDELLGDNYQKTNKKISKFLIIISLIFIVLITGFIIFIKSIKPFSGVTFPINTILIFSFCTFSNFFMSLFVPYLQRNILSLSTLEYNNDASLNFEATIK